MPNDCPDCGSVDRGFRACDDLDFAASDPLNPRFHRQIRCLMRRRTHPSGALGNNVEAVPGPAHFKLRMLEA
eukprot:15466375-Alexandrium_andersonii.AAC.1